MSEVHGIKETKEVLVGLNEVTMLVAKHLKDGAQLTDIMAVIEDFKKDPELIAKLEAARENIAAVPNEVKDVSLLEAGELAMVQISYVPKLIASFSK